MKKSFSVVGVLLPILLSTATILAYGEETSIRNDEYPSQGASSDCALMKNRYIRFLIGTNTTFAGNFGEEAKRQFLHRLRTPIKRAMELDFSMDTDKTFRTFPEDPGYKEKNPR